MQPKYVYELTNDQKRFITVHKKMSAHGLAQILKVGSKKVQDFRKELELKQLSAKYDY